MALKKEQKENLIKTFGHKADDTGSPEVQVAIFTQRIAELTDHLKTHSKDHFARRRLLILVSRRRNMLKYLKSKNASRYEEIIKKLGLRK